MVEPGGRPQLTPGRDHEPVARVALGDLVREGTGVRLLVGVSDRELQQLVAGRLVLLQGGGGDGEVGP